MATRSGAPQPVESAADTTRIPLPDQIYTWSEFKKAHHIRSIHRACEEATEDGKRRFAFGNARRVAFDGQAYTLPEFEAAYGKWAWLCWDDALDRSLHRRINLNAVGNEAWNLLKFWQTYGPDAQLLWNDALDHYTPQQQQEIPHKTVVASENNTSGALQPASSFPENHKEKEVPQDNQAQQEQPQQQQEQQHPQSHSQHKQQEQQPQPQQEQHQHDAESIAETGRIPLTDQKYTWSELKVAHLIRSIHRAEEQTTDDGKHRIALEDARRVALDGRAYTRPEFDAAYGEWAWLCWDEALIRSLYRRVDTDAEGDEAWDCVKFVEFYGSTEALLVWNDAFDRYASQQQQDTPHEKEVTSASSINGTSSSKKKHHKKHQE